MALNWSTVKREHVEAALHDLKAQNLPTKRRGLIVRYGHLSFPAKEVLRVAYRLANALPPATEVRFSSGDGTLSRLQHLGFDVERIGQTQI